jgi:RNA polymerase sigma-70 factor (ECF subfamily)
MKSSTRNRSTIDPTHWVEEYGDYLYTYAYYRVNSKEKAEDIVQDTFLSALKARENFKGESSEKTWLVSILKRKIVDHYRKKSRSKEEEDNQVEYEMPFIKEGTNKGMWDPNRAPADWEDQGIHQIDREEFYKVLKLCISLLPDKWADVFRLKTLEELSSANICKELGISASNLWVILHRARHRLRECFETKWDH